MTNTNAPNSPCHVPVPDGVSECGLSELPSSIHSDDETEHDAFSCRHAWRKWRTPSTSPN